MAIVYGANKTKMNSPTGSNLLDQGVNKSNVCFMYDTYEAAALTAADVIHVCDKLPQGAVICRIDLAFDDLGTGCTLDIGDAVTVDRYADGIDCATAAALTVFPTVTEIAGMGYQVLDTGTASTSSNQLQITLNTSAATGTIKIMVLYAV